MNRYQDLIDEQSKRDIENNNGPMVTIITNKITTPYITKDEVAYVGRICNCPDIPGISNATHIYLNTVFGFKLIRRSIIKSIDGKLIKPIPTEWVIKGSTGNKYMVKRKGSTWECSCPHYTYRKLECKHIKEVRKNESL